MPRNLDRRVEILFPLIDPAVRDVVAHRILDVHLQDTAKARRLRADGSHERVRPENAAEPFDTQAWMIDHRGDWFTPAGPSEGALNPREFR